MIERPKLLKKKSKYLKKPLQLKATINETLQCNNCKETPLKKQSITKSIKFERTKIVPQDKDQKLMELYQKVDLHNKSEDDSQNSEELILDDLQKNEDEDRIILHKDVGKVPLDKKAMLFSHFVKDSYNIDRKLSVIQQKINERIKKYSIESKIKQIASLSVKISPTTTPMHSTSTHTLNKPSKFIEKHHPLSKLENTQALTEINLSNMKLTHLSILSIKQKITKSSRLKILDLSYNNLSNKSIHSLIQILTQNAIEEFSIKWNQFTYEGIIDLIESITSSLNLVSLDISYNKLTNDSPRFTDTFLRLLSKNKYLLHLNLQMCHISSEQSAIIAQEYNLKNQSILCIHFKGNSEYYVNPLGYIVKRIKENIDSSKIYPSSVYRKENSSETSSQIDPKASKFKKLDPISDHFSKYLIGQDCCWLCQHWIRQQFKFTKQIPPKGINESYDDEYFIHINCYDYQPIKMINSECVNAYRGYKKEKDYRVLQWSIYEVYKVEIPIPSNKEVKYFFTKNGRVLLNQTEPYIEVNQNVCFQVFDIFNQKLTDQVQEQNYTVFVKKMNKRSKDELTYNKLKKMNVNLAQYNLKQNYKRQNKMALKNIIKKTEKKLSINTDILSTKNEQSIKSQNQQKKTQSKVQSTKQIAVTIRKCKQRIHIASKSQKYLYLNIIPRNKYYLYNYSLFQAKCISLQEIKDYQSEFSDLKQTYFGNFRENFFNSFLKRRKMHCKQTQLIDKFKIITRKCFNNHQLFFNDIYNYLYSTFLSIATEQAPHHQKPIKEYHNEKQNKNKSVKFLQPKQTKLSILINTQKILENNRKTELTELALKNKKHIERRALSMNCINDKYQLTKIKAMPGGSINTLASGPVITDKTIQSYKNILKQQSSGLLKLCFETQNTTTLELNQEILMTYSTLSGRYRENRVILELISTSEKEKLKDMNEIVQSHNYYKFCRFYDIIVQQKIEKQLKDINSCMDLCSFLRKNKQSEGLENQNKLNHKESIQMNDSIDLSHHDFNLQENRIQNRSAEESLQSFLDFLINDIHPIKILNRTQGIIVKSSKKRKGKYGRSLKNIKEQLMKEESKLAIPTDSSKILQEIQNEQNHNHFNQIVKELNIISQIFIKAIEQLIRIYIQNHSCNEKDKEFIEHWIKYTHTQRIAKFINETLTQYKATNKLQRAFENRSQIYEFYTVNSLMQLVKLSLMLKTSYLQDHCKQYQFISPFHSYEFIINIQITKMTHIIKSIQESSTLIHENFTEVIKIISDIWKRYQVNAIKAEKKRKQAQVLRKKTRHRGINQSLERHLPKQEN